MIKIKTTGDVRIINIPSWLPDFVKDWIYGTGKDKNLVVHSDETFQMERNMKFLNLTVEKGGTLKTNGYNIHVRNLMLLNGTIRL